MTTSREIVGNINNLKIFMSLMPLKPVNAPCAALFVFISCVPPIKLDVLSNIQTIFPKINPPAETGGYEMFY